MIQLFNVLWSVVHNYPKTVKSYDIVRDGYYCVNDFRGKVKPLTKPQRSKLESNIGKLYDLVADEEAYNQAAFREALKTLREDLS